MFQILIFKEAIDMMVLKPGYIGSCKDTQHTV